MSETAKAQLKADFRDELAFVFPTYGQLSQERQEWLVGNLVEIVRNLVVCGDLPERMRAESDKVRRELNEQAERELRESMEHQLAAEAVELHALNAADATGNGEQDSYHYQSA